MDGFRAKGFQNLLIIGIVLLSALLYWNTLDNEFVNWDDDSLIVNNQYIRSLDTQNIRAIFTPGVVGTYQPIRNLSYAIDYHFWQLNPKGYHLTNIVFHACNTFLVYLIVAAFTGEFTLACLTSLLFAIHPVHVEAVAWLSGRRDVLSTAFALLSFWSFTLFVKKRFAAGSARTGIWAWYYVCSLLCCLLGLLAKPSVVMLPGLFLFHELCFSSLSVRKWVSRVGWYLPFFLMSLGFMGISLFVAKGAGVAKATYHGGSWYTTLLTMLRVFSEYVTMLIFPRKLSASYGVHTEISAWTLEFGLTVLPLAVLLLLYWCSWKRARYAFWGISWFFIALLPVSNIIPISTVKADRYLYLPSIGLCLALSWSIVFCWNLLKRIRVSENARQKLLWGYKFAILLVLVSYAVQTRQRNRDWKTSESLWAATLDVNPENPIALNNLGLLYAEQGQFEEALALFEKLLDSDVWYERIDGVWVNIGHVQTELGDFKSALDAYQQALRHNPDSEELYVAMGRVYVLLGEYDAALENFQQMRSQNASSAYVLLGDACLQFQKFPCAIDAYESAIALGIEKTTLSEKLEHAQRAEKHKGPPLKRVF